MLYQQEMRLPIDTELLTPDNDGEDVDSDSIIVQRQRSRHKKTDYDALEKYPIEIEVLVENTADKQRKGGKLNPACIE